MTTMLTQDMQSKLYWYRAVCNKVVDGDTIDVSIDVGFGIVVKQRLRFYGINTPETSGPKAATEKSAGIKSTIRVQQLLRPDTGPVGIWIQTFKDDSDKYGRLLANVWLSVGNPKELVCLNELLVSEGLAVVAKY